MDLSKQSTKGRQTQHHLSHKSQASSVTKDQQPQQQLSDPIQSIANVLNHHSKFVQNKKKNQEKQQASNKLDQATSRTFSASASSNYLVQPQQQQVLQQKKPLSQDSGSSSAVSCSHNNNNNNNQVDQGNSYLYAYNDFVTSTSTKELELACGAPGKQSHRKQEQGSNQANSLAGKIHESLQGVNRIPLTVAQLDESEFQVNHADCLIESDEDDALSYILHQHKTPHHKLLHELQRSSNVEESELPCRLYQQQQVGSEQPDSYLAVYEETLSNFEAHRIDHHLSCSRSSHPRHICGIGSRNDTNLNHIAARLREESQRAFVLNQRSSGNRNSAYINSNHHNHNHHNLHHHSDHDNQLINNDIDAIQSHQFTHDLTVLHNQLANGRSSVKGRDNQYHHHHLSFHKEKLVPDITTAYLEAAATTAAIGENDADLHTGGGGQENLAFDRKELLLESAGQQPQQGGKLNGHALSSSSQLVVNDTSDSSSGGNDQTTSLTQEALQPAPLRARQINSGYFNWLVCSFGNFFGAPITQQQSRSGAGIAHEFTNAHSDLHHYNHHQQLQGEQQQLTNRRGAYANEPSVVSMYTTSQQSGGGGGGQLGGQPGAYYATQAPQAEAVLNSAYTNHAHHLHHHHHYPISSDSSLGSSGPFASSALRINNFFRSCCSKKCFFVSCLMLILLIFIVVIGLTAYLNFLINLNKTNLTPLSGRLKVDAQGDHYIEQLANRTSKEFLAKQQQYETILRGAFDRTQNLLKSYPNHLVKCEVYSFKPGSLWVYFRLFINKRTLLQDNLLMKRKSPEEHVDRHFLPRLTQQTLHSGFEQLVLAFNREAGPASTSMTASELRRSRSSQTAELRQAAQAASMEPRNLFASASSSSSLPAALTSQRDHVKSFDDQISRMMPIIESIDLQSIQVTPDFDMLQTSGGLALPLPPSMSDNLRASQPLTTPPSTVMVATGAASNKNEYDLSTTSTIQDGQAIGASSTSRGSTARPVSTTPSFTGSNDEINVSTKMFTLTGYKENITRPTTSSRPTIVTPQNSLFLNNLQRKPTTLSTSQSPPVATNVRVNESEIGVFGNLRQANTVRESPVSSGKQNSDSPEFPKEKVVGLVFGKPVISQNSNKFDNKLSSSTGNSKNITTIFAPFLKLDHAQNSNNSITGLPSSQENSTQSVDKARSGVGQRERETNESASMQMATPSHKIETGRHEIAHDQVVNDTRVLNSAIQDLWESAIGNKRNGTSRGSVGINESEQQPRRLITVTTIGGGGVNRDVASDSIDGSKISFLSREISNTIRTQIKQNTPLTMTTATSITTPSTFVGLTSQQSPKPKVSPLLKQGGSIISTAVSRQQADTNSAVVLNKDLVHSTNEPNHGEGQLLGSASNTTQQMSPRLAPSRSDKLQQQQPSQRKPNGQSRANPSTAASASTTTTSTTTTATTHDHSQAPAATVTHTPAVAPNNEQKRKPTAKEPKEKKLSALVESKNGTQMITQPGSLINSKGIRIVDEFLATIEQQPNRAGAGQQPIVAIHNSTHSTNNRNHKNKTQEPFNYNVDQLMPTTIDLIRSVGTTRASNLHQTQPDAVRADYTTTSPSLQRVTTPMTPIATEIRLLSPPVSNSPSLASFIPTNPFVGPKIVAVQQSSGKLVNKQTPTSNFSNQWKPITNSTSEGANGKNSSVGVLSSRKPNMSFIVGHDKLPASMVNVPSSQGSQSPFAMSPSILETQLRLNGNTGQRSNLSGGQSRFHKITSNSYHSISNSGPNDFESHRVSRMRQGESSPSASEQLGVADISSTTAATLTSEPRTRFVDDFMITTDRVEAGGLRSTTVLPLINDRFEPLAKVRTVNPLDQAHPKRTRGPFAFETLKSVSSSDNRLPQSDMIEVFPSRSERSPPSGRLADTVLSSMASIRTDHKLLVRKKLFLGSGVDDELSTASTINPSFSADQSDLGKASPFTNLMTSNNQDDNHHNDDLDDFGNRRHDNRTKEQPVHDHSNNANTSIRCQYFGCKAKDSKKFICLNYTQICDDFIDCQDDSDELDCVSLLKHDSKSNKLSFSNGDGIIYLNRKGSLAPLCIDYYSEGETRLGNVQSLPAGTAEPSLVESTNRQKLDLAKSQELIKQINTIGQYACSLQSFSRLVSVKINHHDLVDSLNLIKASKLYHKLSIVDGSEFGIQNRGSDDLLGSYKSGSTQHEVELVTSADCPSQRTVFVKCGSFDCGQDSFSTMDRNNASKGRDGVIINDFPWLVKLYWMGALSCHGYLIDELWLISSRECFAERTSSTDDVNKWTAEISYEHYGNDDYQSIESNRRNIQDILIQPAKDSNNGGEPSIVLAKLEKPVRFSPLNRPICLPPAALNKTLGVAAYKDCVTATLPMADTSPPTQDLLLNKVKLHDPRECLLPGNPGNNRKLDNLICAEQETQNNVRINEVDTTRVLICSTGGHSNRSRSKWTVVGVQNNAQALRLATNRRLFTTVSSQLDWIVDTMNPKSHPNLKTEGINFNGNELNPLNTLGSQNQTCNRFKCSSGECLSWSRICDGLYDCSSHEDEKDCHK